MGSDNEMVDVAKAIHWYLPRLVTGAEASTLNAELADLIVRARTGEDVSAAIRAVLERFEPVHDWAVDYLRHDGTPPDLDDERIAPSLPGSGEPLPVRRYECPHCGFPWWRRNKDQQPPECPIDRVTVVPAGR